jgi:hypothetical protein
MSGWSRRSRVPVTIDPTIADTGDVLQVQADGSVEAGPISGITDAATQAELDAGLALKRDLSRTFNAQTDSYTLALADAYKVITVNKATATTVTVPTDAAVALPVGTEVDVVQLGAGLVTVAGAGGVTVSAIGGVLNTGGQYGALRLTKIAANVWVATAVSGASGATTVMQVRDEKTSGTNGGTFTSGAWQTRDLNTTKLNTISGASLASNTVTLPAGTYVLHASCPAYSVGVNQTRLYNVTDSAVIAYGPGGYFGNATDKPMLSSQLRAAFTLAAQKDVRIEHQCQVTKATDGFGVANGLGTEVYTDCVITKIA